jgi:hypothetical protein
MLSGSLDLPIEIYKPETFAQNANIINEVAQPLGMIGIAPNI